MGWRKGRETDGSNVPVAEASASLFSLVGRSRNSKAGRSKMSYQSLRARIEAITLGERTSSWPRNGCDTFASKIQHSVHPPTYLLRFRSSPAISL
jgi:hypothetical protein